MLLQKKIRAREGSKGDLHGMHAPQIGTIAQILLFRASNGGLMKFFALIVGLLMGSYSFALAQSSTSGMTGGGNQNSSSMAGAAGTNVGGTIHTNQGNPYGNSAAGGATEDASRKG
jgi:hypothetical protein